uniref:RNA-dependent RNA polymerase n=1 Tax=Suillus luteus narnavirus 3 TaxID=3067822 RepID=A0AA49X6W2_9VIRU|nr:RNA-dependent RNA polymerase [Suillus luteus narnavirus 3]
MAWIEIYASKSPALYHGILRRSRSNAISQHELERQQTVRRQFAEFACAFTSSYGHPRFTTFGTRNFKLALGFVEFLQEFITRGVQSVKSATHYWRAKALGDSTRDLKPACLPSRLPLSEPQSLLIASTLVRSLSLKISDDVLAEGVEQAIKRWTMIPEQVSEGLIQRVYEHVFKLFRPLHQRYMEIKGSSYSCPQPASKATIEYKSRDNGCIAGLHDLLSFSAEMEHHKQDPPLEEYPPLAGSEFPGMDEATMRLMMGALSELSMNLTPDFNSNVYGHIEEKKKLTDLEAYRVSKYYTRRLAKAGMPNKYPTLPDDLMRPTLRPVPIRELGGKVRVASLHRSSVAHYSRAMACRFMPMLKQLRATRYILYGEEIRIQRTHRNAKIFSADLTAASDFIDHQLGQKVLQAIADALQFSDTDREALMQCICSMEVENRTGTDGSPLLTRQGAHMGLGTTWTVLSLLNHYAATIASDKQSSFAICGDDLVGYWTEAQSKVYTNTIAHLGLVPNVSKSYEGERGVFCEAMVVPTGRDGMAISFSHPSIAELCCSRSKPGNTQLGEMRNWLTKRLTTQARRTLKATISRYEQFYCAGAVGLGGSGNVKNDSFAVTQFFATLRGTRVGTSKKHDELLSNLAEELKPHLVRKIDNKDLFVNLDDALVELAMGRDRQRVSEGRTAIVQEILSDKKIRGAAHRALRDGLNSICEIFNTSGPYFTRFPPRLPKAGSVFVKKEDAESRRSKDDTILVRSGGAYYSVPPLLPKAGSVFRTVVFSHQLIRNALKLSTHISSHGKRVIRHMLSRMEGKSSKINFAKLLKAAQANKTSGFIPAELLSAKLRDCPVRHRQDGTEINFRWETEASN